MAFDDLDLEFEDEDDAKIKKNEAVHVDVDLEFNSPEGGKAQPPQAPRRPAIAGTAPNIPRVPPTTAPSPQQQPPATVRKIEDARAAQARPAAPQPRVVGTSALKEEVYDYEAHQALFNEKIRKVEIEAEIKIQVAEFKMELLSDVLSDMKMAEHQIGQLLVRMVTKHPESKNEALMIKKILADFTAKKRK